MEESNKQEEDKTKNFTAADELDYRFFLMFERLQVEINNN